MTEMRVAEKKNRTNRRILDESQTWGVCSRDSPLDWGGVPPDFRSRAKQRRCNPRRRLRMEGGPQRREEWDQTSTSDSIREEAKAQSEMGPRPSRGPRPTERLQSGQQMDTGSHRGAALLVLACLKIRLQQILDFGIFSNSCKVQL